VDFYSSYRVKFHVDLSNKDFVSNAQLRLKKSRLTTGEVNAIMEDQIDLKILTKPDNYYDEFLPRFVTSERVRYDSLGEVLIFNVSQAIAWWAGFNKRDQSNKILFEIHIHCTHTLPKGVRYAPNLQFFSNSDQDARLVITTYQSRTTFSDDDDENSRRKRHSSTSERRLEFCNPDQIECCLSELPINFVRDFNWTWIIRPREVRFNYCKGECPLRWAKTTRHSELLERFRVRVQKNPAAAAEPCCVTNRFRSLTLLVFVDGKYRFDLLEDIISAGCACR
jgi:hypothetical protein